MTTAKRIRVIGIGNLLMGDDGLGVVAIEQLGRRHLPANIELIDGGCGGITLLQLISECDQAIIIDAADFGEKPGAILQLCADEINELQELPAQASLHQTGLAEVLSLAKKLEKLPPLKLFLVQPERVERGLGLTETIEQVLPQLLDMLIKELPDSQN